MLGKNEGYCTCLTTKEPARIGKFVKVPITEEGICIYCGYYTVQGKIDNRGICKRGERNFKGYSTKGSHLKYDKYTYDRVWNRKLRS